MTVQEALTGSGLAKADGEVLLATLLQKDRTWLLAHRDDAVPSPLLLTWHEWAERRKRGEPVAYITGTKEFFGHTFRVTPDVLIPRPATELLVECTLELLNQQTARKELREIDTGIVACINLWKTGARCIVDIGTGSGCIAITCALERPYLRVIATDSSEAALTIARENAQRLGASHLEFLLGDALDPLSLLQEPFLIVSNPPYIATDSTLEKDVVDFEPHHALFAGRDGADILRAFTQQARAHPHCIGYTLECTQQQATMFLD